MFQEIKSERFDAKEGKWIMELQMTTGYIQTVTFVNEQSLAEYRKELLAAANQQKMSR